MQNDNNKKLDNASSGEKASAKPTQKSNSQKNDKQKGANDCGKHGCIGKRSFAFRRFLRLVSGKFVLHGGLYSVDNTCGMK